MRDQAICPACGKATWLYRIARWQDQAYRQEGAATICTGPQHFVAHGCKNDHGALLTEDRSVTG